MGWKKKMVPKTTNNLTQAIIDYLTKEGHKAFRVNNEGQFEQINPTSLNYSNVSHHILPLRAFGYIIGRFRKSATEKGISDILCCLKPKGLFLAIEVKFQQDRQSEDQKKWEQEIIAAGGLYYVAKEYDDFVKYFQELKAFYL